MGRFHSYINSAKQLLSLYKGGEPFSGFLKSFFSANKKYGSKDRKQVAHLCYCYFRAARLFPGDTAEEQILKSLFLCSDKPVALLAELKPEWNNYISSSYRDKCSMLTDKCSMLNLFPWKEELSDGIEFDKFCESILVQPDLFLRIRPGMKDLVLEKFKASGLKFEVFSDDCIAVTNSSKAEDVVDIYKEVAVQDYSSQRVGEFLRLIKHRPSAKVWDCCAASGGKSILAKDIFGDIDLTVTDVRDSILANLRKRFSEAGIRNYKSQKIDLTKEEGDTSILNNQYAVIIADVPCTGSGTWSRTPEQLYYFDQRKIEEFALLQARIVSTVVSRLEAGGYFLYITCSVFKKENEDMVHFIKEKFHLVPVRMELLKGYDKKADTMYAALLQKPL